MKKGKKETEITIDLRIYRDGAVFVAHSPYIDIASQGDTVEDAESNFIEAFSLWLETASSEEIESRIPYPTCDESRVFSTRVKVPYHHGRVANPIGC
jgi:predicted RNase H-like HicB family nuclease